MPTAGFELAVSASERTQTQALDRAAIGIGGVASEFRQNAVKCTPAYTASFLWTIYLFFKLCGSFEDGQKLPFLNT
jgi:hypothetical protein